MLLLTLLWSHIVSMHIVSMLMLLWSTTTNRKLHRSPQMGVVPPTELIITYSIAAVVMDDLLMIGGDPY